MIQTLYIYIYIDLNILFPQKTIVQKTIWDDLYSYLYACYIVEVRSLKHISISFLSNRLEYDRSDSFPFDFEPNGITFSSKSKGKLPLRSYSIQFEETWKCVVLSVSIFISKTIFSRFKIYVYIFMYSIPIYIYMHTYIYIHRYIRIYIYLLGIPYS